MDFEDLDEINGIHFFILDFFVEIFYFEAQSFYDVIDGIWIGVCDFAAEYFLYGTIGNAGAVLYLFDVKIRFFFEFFEFDIYHFTLHTDEQKAGYDKKIPIGFGRREDPVVV